MIRFRKQPKEHGVINTTQDDISIKHNRSEISQKKQNSVGIIIKKRKEKKNENALWCQERVGWAHVEGW